MNKRNRNRLLTLARFLDRFALRIRIFVKARTPKRARRSNVVEIKKGAA